MSRDCLIFVLNIFFISFVIIAIFAKNLIINVSKLNYEKDLNNWICAYPDTQL